MSLKKLLQNNSIERIPIRNTDMGEKIRISKRPKGGKKIVALYDPDTDDAAHMTAHNAILQQGMRRCLVGDIAQNQKTAIFDSTAVHRIGIVFRFQPGCFVGIWAGMADSQHITTDSTGTIPHPDAADLAGRAGAFVSVSKRILGIP